MQLKSRLNEIRIQLMSQLLNTLMTCFVVNIIINQYFFDSFFIYEKIFNIYFKFKINSIFSENKNKTQTYVYIK
jgi:hypothetical protein